MNTKMKPIIVLTRKDLKSHKKRSEEKRKAEINEKFKCLKRKAICFFVISFALSAFFQVLFIVFGIPLETSIYVDIALGICGILVCVALYFLSKAFKIIKSDIYKLIFILFVIVCMIVSALLIFSPNWRSLSS